MEVLIVLMIASLIIASIFLVAFIWSVKSDQYEDTYTPSVRVIMDEKDHKKKNKLNKSGE